MKKKADSQPGYLVKLLLLLIIIAVSIPIYYQIKVKFSEGTTREIRQQNVNQLAKSNTLKLRTYNELSFPIIRLDVKEGNELEDSSRALVHDWSDLLKGEVQLFKSEKEKIVYCIPGHYLKFKANDKKIPAMEYIKYQKEHTLNDIGAKHIKGDMNVYISEYLKGHTTNKEVFEEEMKTLKESLSDHQDVTIVSDIEFFEERNKLKGEYAINTAYEYTTVFVYMKKGYWGKWLSTLVGTNVGIVGATTVGLILVPFTGGGSLVITAVALGAAGSGVAGGIIGYKTANDVNADWDTGIFLVPNKAEILKDLSCDILPARGET